MRRHRVVHVMFSGLGGHGAVVLPQLESPANGADRQHVVFVGTVPPRAEYTHRCEAAGAGWTFVRGGGAHAQWAVFRALCELAPDVTVIHSAGSVVAAAMVRLLRRRSRLVVVQHQASHLQDRKYSLLNPIMLAVADRVVVLTPEAGRALVLRYPFLTKWRPPEVIPNGVDLTVFAPQPPSPDPPPVRVGMQSRLIDIKDHPTLIDAVADLVSSGLDVQLHLAGDGAARRSLERHAAARGLDDRVVFHGMLDEGPLIDLLGTLHVYVHATKGEAMSTAILQAMALGLPVLASDVPGTAALAARHGVPRLVPAADRKALASAIAEIVDRPENAADLGARCLEAARSYSVETSVELHRRLLDELLGEVG